MNRYSPVWSQITDSSLWCESDCVVKVFLTMIAKKDLDEIVRGSAFTIGQWAKKTEAETIEALKILSSPDTKRIEPQPFEGRRIEKVAEGWLVLNGGFYRRLMGRTARREYKREWQANDRALKRQGRPASKEMTAVRVGGETAERLAEPESRRHEGRGPEG